MDENRVSRLLIGAAIEVHRILGPGLLESVYRQALVHELELPGVPCRAEVLIPAHYKGLEFTSGYRVDLLVADLLIVELKVVESLLPVHEAQLLSYLRMTGKRLGLLINFNVAVLRNGIKRIVNNL